MARILNQHTTTEENNMTILITKQEVVRRFKSEVMPSLREQEARRGHIDTHARVQEWSNFVDMLNKEGLVNDNQVFNWTTPKFIGG